MLTAQWRQNCVAITFHILSEALKSNPPCISQTLTGLRFVAHSWIYTSSLEFLFESVSLPVLTQSQGTPFFPFLCLSFATIHALWSVCSTQTLEYLHGDTHTVYRPTLKVRVTVRLFFNRLYLSSLWTVTTVERQRQQIRGFPLHGLWSPRQHSWVDKHWPRHELAYQRISQEVQRLSLRVVVVVAIVVAVSQWMCAGESRYAYCTCFYLISSMKTSDRNRTPSLYVDNDTPERRHIWHDVTGFPIHRTLQSGMFTF